MKVEFEVGFSVVGLAVSEVLSSEMSEFGVRLEEKRRVIEA